MKPINALYGTLAGAALMLVCIDVNAGDNHEPCKEKDSQTAAVVKAADKPSTVKSSQAAVVQVADSPMPKHNDAAAPHMGGEGDGAIGGNAPNPTPDRSASTVVDDAAITAKVKAKLLGDSTVSGMKIDVDTRSGVVYLTGDNMKSQAAIDQAMKLAKSADGVNSVVSKLAVGDVKKSP